MDSTDPAQEISEDIIQHISQDMSQDISQDLSQDMSHCTNIEDTLNSLENAQETNSQVIVATRLKYSVRVSKGLVQVAIQVAG